MFLEVILFGSYKKRKEIEQQGLLDKLIFDERTLENMKAIINAVDADKVRQIMNALHFDDDGWLRLKIDLGIKK